MFLGPSNGREQEILNQLHTGGRLQPGDLMSSPFDSSVGNPVQNSLETSDLDGSVMVVQPLTPRLNLSAVQVKNPRLSGDKVANVVIVTGINPDGQIGVIHGFLDKGDGRSGLTKIKTIGAAGPRVGVGGSGMDGSLDIKSVQVVGSVHIKNTIRERVGNVTGSGVGAPHFVHVFTSRDSPLVSWLEVRVRKILYKKKQKKEEREKGEERDKKKKNQNKPLKRVGKRE